MQTSKYLIGKITCIIYKTQIAVICILRKTDIWRICFIIKYKLAMRQAHIFYKDQLAGILTENDAGYEFRYFPR